ncbi:MAG: hypothetical protein LBD56_00180 [Endomicrobium sp.]|jgi:hypothetical protein|nr:hypothetical protein [Endomicrobium sp.]
MEKLIFVPLFFNAKIYNLADFKSEYENKHSYSYFIDDEDLINLQEKLQILEKKMNHFRKIYKEG